MKEELFKIPKEVDSYLNFIKSFDLYENSCFNFINELFAINNSLIKALDRCKIILDDDQFLRFGDVFYNKISTVLYEDFNELNSYNKWSKHYQYIQLPSNIRYENIIRISEDSLIGIRLRTIIDTIFIEFDEDDSNTLNLQNDFIKIATNLSVKEAVEYCQGLYRPNSSDSKFLLRNKYEGKSLAMFHYYSGQPINRKNKDKIGKSYGYLNGDKLYGNYNDFTKKTKRVSSGTKRQNTQKNKYFEQAIELLKENGFVDKIDKINRDLQLFLKNIDNSID